MQRVCSDGVDLPTLCSDYACITLCSDYAPHHAISNRPCLCSVSEPRLQFVIDTDASTSGNADIDTGYVRNTEIDIDTDIDTGYKIQVTRYRYIYVYIYMYICIHIYIYIYIYIYRKRDTYANTSLIIPSLGVVHQARRV